MDKVNSTLQLFLDELCRLSGLHVCLYDLNYFTQDSPKLHIGNELRSHCSPLCELIKSNEGLHQKCVETEYFRAEEANRREDPFVHTCYAGITDIVVPVRRGQKQIGALYLGQVLTLPADQQAALLKAISEAVHIPLAAFQEASASMPSSSQQELENRAIMVRFVKEYIEQVEELLERNSEAAPSVSPGTVRIEDVPTPTLDRLQPESSAIREAIQIMKKRYWLNIDLPQVARAVGMSESHFSRQFRRETGLVFRQCLAQTRIATASYLLKKSELSISEISRLLGYVDSSSLHRAFKLHIGCTPQMFLRRQPPPWHRDVGEQEM